MQYVKKYSLQKYGCVGSTRCALVEVSNWCRLINALWTSTWWDGQQFSALLRKIKTRQYFVQECLEILKVMFNTVVRSQFKLALY